MEHSKKYKCSFCIYRSDGKYNIKVHHKNKHKDVYQHRPLHDSQTSQPQTQPPFQPESIKGQLKTSELPKSEFARNLMDTAGDYEANKIDANLITEHFKLKDYYMSMRNKYKNLAKMEKKSILELLKRRKTISKCVKTNFKKAVM